MISTCTVERTDAQENVRAAFAGTIVHEAPGENGAITYVTRGYFDPRIDCTVISVAPDGQVQSWTVNGHIPKTGTVYVTPHHFDLSAYWRELWEAGCGEWEGLGTRAGKFPYAEYVLYGTHGYWQIAGVQRARNGWVVRFLRSPKPPAALAQGLNLVHNTP